MSNLSGPSVASRDRLATLDLVRLIAAVAVMVYHFAYRYAPSLDPWWPAVVAVARHGYLGVDAFFVLSGYVILRSVAGRTPGEFVRGRLLRLYPEFWLAVIASAVVLRSGVSDFGGSPSTATILANLSMVPTFIGFDMLDGVYWTLAVEIKFYGVIWLLMLLRQLPRIERWLQLGIALSAVACVVELPTPVRSAILHPFGAYFAVGGLLHLAHRHGWTAARAIGVAVAAPVLVYQSFARGVDFLRPEDLASRTPLAAGVVTLLTLGIFLLLPRLRLRERAAARARTAGALTYPLYLCHNGANAIFLLSSLGGPVGVRFVLAVLSAVALAWGIMRVGTGPLQRGLARLLDLVPPLRARTTAPART